MKLQAKKNGEQFSPRDEALSWKARLDKVLEGNMEQQERPYSKEEKIALEQTRGFSYTLEEIGTMVQKAKDFHFPIMNFPCCQDLLTQDPLMFFLPMKR